MSQPLPLIKAENISLMVPTTGTSQRSILASPLKTIRDLYWSTSKRNYTTIIKDVSLILEPGMRLGVMGVNGAGKSTLLRMLAGIYQPTTGTLTINGDAKGLFDVSLGMHPEATGLENIRLRGLQMGLRSHEIAEKMQDVVDFSELGDALHNQYFTYSAGMRLRLAFSVSTMIDPDILLLDEWLGAGDAKFREKTADRMMNLVEKSRGIILATHNKNLMRRVCNHGIVIDKGEVKFMGDLYEAEMFFETEIMKLPVRPVRKNRPENTLTEKQRENQKKRRQNNALKKSKKIVRKNGPLKE